MGRITWSNKEIQVLQEQYATISNPADLIPLLNGKTYKAVKTKVRKLGLNRQVATRRENSDTPEVIEYLTKNYLTTNVNQMSIAIKRSETYVKGAMKRLNLVQPPELIKQFALDSRFKKGNVSFNKGKKQTEFMSPEKIERTKATRFKKGGKNFNELYDGALSFRFDKSDRPYVFIRLGKSKWEYLQVYVWECTVGTIPKGHCVAFKDGNTMDCTPENLELITRQELMRRNSASVNLSDGYVAHCLAWRDKEKAAEYRKHPELIELKRQTLNLNRTIHEQQQKVS